MAQQVPEMATDAVLVRSTQVPADAVQVKGYDFNEGVDYHKLLSSFHSTGFQATNMALAVNEINRMVNEQTHAMKNKQNNI